MEQKGRKLYADVIVDISHERLDRVYQYRIPAGMQAEIIPGSCVEVPFGRGNRLIRAYVTAVREDAELEDDRIKEIHAVSGKGLTIESRLIRLAAWIRQTYGSTMIQALHTVLPVRDRNLPRTRKQICLLSDRQAVQKQLEAARKKGHRAKARLLERLLEVPVIDQAEAVRQTGIGTATLKKLSQDGVIRIFEEGMDGSGSGMESYPPPAAMEADSVNATGASDGASAELQLAGAGTMSVSQAFHLTEPQQEAVSRILDSWIRAPQKPVLLEGVTGSGKTLVYMELTEEILRQGRQVIVLIPEIALSWQIENRFRERFGEAVITLHSRMSKSERYACYEKARRGGAKIVVGPRSALFTPFSNAGLIIIDEEQETSYRSEETPRYDARETAIMRAKLEGAHVVMGSATPSVDSAEKCRKGEYLHVRLPERFGSARLPAVQIVDMRQELREGNRSMFSRALQEEIRGRLARKEQVMLFLNKRGFAGFISCRNCGTVLKCPHCDVSLTAHRDGMLVCHYCGYRTRQTGRCPSCGSMHIHGFRAGTEKAEAALAQMFPQARILRMDADTTKGKEGHDRILRAFAAGEADVLIGTQMIVKGHDFPKVTLVGVLLADLSLYANDYRAAERTYQLMVQAVGRAGRGAAPGMAVIQTYSPDHYSIQAAAKQNYPAFFSQEMQLRELTGYPPAAHLLAIHISCRDEEKLDRAAGYMARYLRRVQTGRQVRILGPAPEAIAKVQEYYRQVISVKSSHAEDLIRMRRLLESYIEINSGFQEIRVQYDLDR